MATSPAGWALRSLPASCLSRHLCILHIIYQFRHPGIWGVDLLLCQSDGYQPCGLGLAVAPGVLPPATFVHPAHHLPISPPGHLGGGLTLASTSWLPALRAGPCGRSRRPASRDICASCTSSTNFATRAFGGWTYSCA